MSQSLSLSAVERGNPPPRRKSCAGCIKAKRRCTLELPVCQRCAQRKIDCRYPSIGIAKRPAPGTIATPATTGHATRATTQPNPHYIPPVPNYHPQLSLPLPPVAWSPSGTGTDMFQWDGATYLPDPSPPQTTSEQLPLPPIATPSAAEPPSAAPPEPRLAVDANDAVISQQSSAASLMPLHSFNPQSALFRSPLDPSISTSPPLNRGRPVEEIIHHAIKTRLQYTLDKVMAAPQQMVTENHTPWCHPHLYEYEMPKSMQDAYSSCALYMAKNPANAHVIHRSVESRVQDLISTPIPLTPLEVLARTHALLLYQILRLFSDDLRTRTAAESTMHHLEDAALALIAHVAFDEITFDDSDQDPHDDQQQLPNPIHIPESVPRIYPVSPRRKFWDLWVFQESARRTCLIAFIFLQLYRVMTGHIPLYCDHTVFMSHSITLSAHLWTAKDAFGFAAAWRGRKHFVVSNADFLTLPSLNDTFRDAKGDDIDVYGKMIITVIIGIEETKDWLLTRGGEL
ncbi:hypothetical protein B0T19DRAFT_427564 [Cercophora scortea]|uniref:Zn(2)-C6 fungal-type domain-containing protein n=1 Tax=Cercophora scortea TaxID=314031 RepID=A0AAE0IFD3_9PEZI|nr:hypothetical protein B0T19DRAFT_427564 [Cercophora scortea]